jgi:hypothetical protein
MMMTLANVFNIAAAPRLNPPVLAVFATSILFMTMPSGTRD